MANSGARIGLAEKVMNHFNVTWIDKENPNSDNDDNDTSKITIKENI